MSAAYEVSTIPALTGTSTYYTGVSAIQFDASDELIFAVFKLSGTVSAELVFMAYDFDAATFSMSKFDNSYYDQGSMVFLAQGNRAEAFNLIYKSTQLNKYSWLY